MKISPLFILILLLPTHFAFGQFFIVADKDGYVNVRSTADSKSRVVDTLNNGHFIYFFEEQKGNWRKVEYSRNGKDRAGYIYNDRLISIGEYDSIPLQHYDANTATCSRNSIKIIVTKQKFDKTKYRFTYADHQIIKINGKQYWGTDGEQPRTEYKSIVILNGSRKIVLPHTAFDNLFEPTIYNTEAHYDPLNDIFYIRSQNSDGAGAYDVVWRVVKGMYTDRDIEYGF
jgi:hypothetical protein